MITIYDFLAEIYSKHPLPQISEKLSNVAAFKTASKIFPPTITSKRFCGIEIELENCSNTKVPLEELEKASNELKQRTGFDYTTIKALAWKTEIDGSLRNEGLEFISRVGMTFNQASVMVHVLNEWLKIAFPKAEANPRTGLHVHVDVRDFRLLDLQRLLMVYLVFEQTLFKFSGARQNNLFCVPLADTQFPLGELTPCNTAKELYNILERNAKKYMGLNLLPITTQGTIEFRMHKGSRNPSEIIRWLQIISDLATSTSREGRWNDSLETSSVICNLRRTNLVVDFMKEIFPNSFQYLVPFLDEKDVHDGIDKMKELLVSVDQIPEEFLLGGKKRLDGIDMNWFNDAIRFRPPQPQPAGRREFRVENIRVAPDLALALDGMRVEYANIQEEVAPAPALRQRFNLDEEGVWIEVVDGRAANVVPPQPIQVSEHQGNNVLSENTVNAYRGIVNGRSLVSRIHDINGNGVPQTEDVPDPMDRVMVANWCWIHYNSIIEVYNINAGVVEHLFASTAASLGWNSYIFICVLLHGHREMDDEQVDRLMNGGFEPGIYNNEEF